jgi:hypothetical protein
MAKLYGREYTQDELSRLVGDMSQVAGVRLARLDDGREAGVRAAEVYTGSGFRFTVLLDRGMDIGPAEHDGRALAWKSATGAAGPTYFEPEGLGWLRTFHGGLIVTCGLIYAGAPSTDGDQEFGLHGRISHIPATNVWTDAEWQGDDYVMWVQGKVREAAVFQENLVLTRKVWAKMGESRLFIEDVVENEGFQTTPNMMLYHCNLGFPIVDEGAELLLPSIEVIPRTEIAAGGLDRHNVMDPPTPGYFEQVFYHKLKADEEGMVTAALINPNVNQGQGLGLYVHYRQRELPLLIEWKMMGESTYVVGMEPSNCMVDGRQVEREAGRLVLLEPGQRAEYFLEIGVLTTPEELEGIRDRISGT